MRSCLSVLARIPLVVDEGRGTFRGSSRRLRGPALAVLIPWASTLLAQGPPPVEMGDSPDLAWQDWGPETLSRAKKEGKPILMWVRRWGSRGCGLAERALVADRYAEQAFRRDYINVRIDADERPDLSAAGLTIAKMSKTGSAREFLVALTPDGRPFFATLLGPLEEGQGPTGAARLWLDRLREETKQAEASVARTVEALRIAQTSAPPRRPTGDSQAALRSLEESFDLENGVLSGTFERFPHAALAFLLLPAVQKEHPAALKMAIQTLDGLARSGLRDHVGGGFFRPVGARGAVCLEKTLEDNALLLRAYARAYAATGKEHYRETAEGIADWLRREMRDPLGGFSAALGSDGPGADGFYLWTKDQIVSALGSEQAKGFFQFYRLDSRGMIVASTSPPPARLAAVDVLLKARNARVAPSTDERVFGFANGYAIGALALSGQLLSRPQDLAAARDAAERLLPRLGSASSLKHFAQGRDSRGSAFLEDYAALAEGLLDLGEAEGDPGRQALVSALVDAAVVRFLDVSSGGFFTNDSAHGPSLVRLRIGYDDGAPSANAIMASVLLRTGRLTGEARWTQLGRSTLESFSGDIQDAPQGTLGLAMAGVGPSEPSPAFPEEIFPPGEKRGPVTLEASLSASLARPGDRIEAYLRLTLAPGWYLTAHEPRLRGLRGLSISIPGGGAVGSPEYPEGSAMRMRFTPEPVYVYAHELTIPIPLRVLRGARPGVTRIRFRVSFQPCDARDCRTPESVLLETPLKVVPSSD